MKSETGLSLTNLCIILHDNVAYISEDVATTEDEILPRSKLGVQFVKFYMDLLFIILHETYLEP